MKYTFTIILILPLPLICLISIPRIFNENRVAPFLSKEKKLIATTVFAYNDSNFKIIEKPFENLRLAYRMQVVSYKFVLSDIHKSKSKTLIQKLDPLLLVNIKPETTFEYDEKEYKIIKEIDSLISKNKVNHEYLLMIENSKNRISIAVYEYNDAVKKYNTYSSIKLKLLNIRDNFNDKVEF